MSIKKLNINSAIKFTQQKQTNIYLVGRKIKRAKNHQNQIILAYNMQDKAKFDFLDAQNQKERKISSDQSFENENDELLQNKQTFENEKLTSYQKLHQYFHLFLQMYNTLETNQNPQRGSKYKAKNQFLSKELSTFLEPILSMPQFQQQQVIKQQLKPDEKLIAFLQKYQTESRQSIENSLLKSKKFSKSQIFTKNLIIHEFYPSKHYEVVKLQIQLLWYKTQIVILNELEKSPMKNFSEISGSGSFGYVYCINIFQEELAIKSIPIQKQAFSEQNEESLNLFRKIIINAIKEYFFILLFSQLEIGPKAKRIGGFDMIIFEDAVLFATEICQQFNSKSADFTPLFQSLFKMHMLQIIHRDIKPTNIMFSQSLNKYVFIDFGCSQIINETIGYKTLTNFNGTTAFCTQQLLALLTHAFGMVDLYYNDFFGLKKTIQLQQPNDKLEFTQQKMYIQSNHFQTILMKYLLYTEKYTKFAQVWQSVNINQQEQIQQIQIQLLKFYPELKPNQFLKNFFWTQITEGNRQKPQFKSLISIFRNETCETLSYFCWQFTKQNDYNFYGSFYKSLPTLHQNFDNQQRQIQIILSNKNKIADKIFTKDLEEQQFEQKSDIKFFLYIAKYSQIGLSQNPVEIQDKIKACQKALALIKSQNPKLIEQIELVFECPIKNLEPINKFFHFFMIKIWQNLPQKYQEESISQIVATLCFLGFPINCQASIDFVAINFIKESPEIENEKAKNQKNQDRLQNIIYYWQTRLSFLIFQNIFYNRAKNKSKLVLSKQFQEKRRIMVGNLMKGQEKQSNKFFDINNKFYDCLLLNHFKFDQKTFNEVFDILNGPQLKQTQFSSYKIKKWRYLMHICLCYISFAYKIKDAWKVYQSIEEVMLFAFKYNKSILPYLTSFFYAQILKTYKNSHIFFEKIDYRIHCREISLRFQIQFRFINALQRDEVPAVHQMTDILIKELSAEQFEIENLQILQKILECIYCFIFNRLKNKNFMTKIQATIIFRCLDIFKMALQAGLRYEEWQKRNLYVKIVGDLDQVSIIAIERALKENILIRCFFVHLIKNGHIFEGLKSHLESYPFLKTLQFELSGLNKKETFETFVLEERYRIFLGQLPKCDKIFNFAMPWIQVMRQNEGIKRLIKNNRTLCLQFISTLIHQRKSYNPAIKTDEIINELFGTITAQSFDTESQPLNLPNEQVVFDYFFLKVNMTNYDRHWCQQIITLYRILVKKGNFDRIIYKEEMMKTIFYCFLKTENTYDEIEGLIQNYTIFIKQNPIDPIIKSVQIHLNKFFWCQCSQCLQLKKDKWVLSRFIETLYDKISISNSHHNPYMSLTYLYCLAFINLRTEVAKKFIVFIIKSLNLVVSEAKDLMKQRIYYFVYKVNHSFFVGVFYRNSWTKDYLWKYRIPMAAMNGREFRRFAYFFINFKKNEPQEIYQIEDHIEKRFFREYVIEGYKYPANIKEIYRRKLRRYYYVKENNILSETDIGQKQSEVLEKK